MITWKRFKTKRSLFYKIYKDGKFVREIEGKVALMAYLRSTCAAILLVTSTPMDKPPRNIYYNFSAVKPAFCKPYFSCDVNIGVR